VAGIRMMTGSNLGRTLNFAWISTARFRSRHLKSVIFWVQSFDVRWSEGTASVVK